MIRALPRPEKSKTGWRGFRCAILLVRKGKSVRIHSEVRRLYGRHVLRDSREALKTLGFLEVVWWIYDKLTTITQKKALDMYETTACLFAGGGFFLA